MMRSEKILATQIFHTCHVMTGRTFKPNIRPVFLLALHLHYNGQCQVRILSDFFNRGHELSEEMKIPEAPYTNSPTSN